MGFLTFMPLRYYTPQHFIMMALAVAVFCGLYFSLNNRSEKIVERVLMIVFAVNGALFVSYKIFMWATYEEFVLLNELPLHLCNFNVILLPVALLTRNKFLFSYLFYVGTLGAFAAVAFFDTFFMDKSIFDYAVFIYFFYHSILLAGGVTIAALGIYTPRPMDILKAYATLISIATAMHGVNFVLRSSGACAIANYFYTYGMPGNPILGTLFNLIPVPVLYMIPILPVAGTLNLLMYLPFVKRVNRQKLQARAAATGSQD